MAETDKVIKLAQELVTFSLEERRRAMKIANLLDGKKAPARKPKETTAAALQPVASN